MTETMRAAVYHGPRDVRIERVPRPRPARGELLLRVHANGLCGTDASEYVAGPQMYPLHARHPLTGHEGPIIPGHEFAGRVAELGEDVEGFGLGDLVVTGAALWCGVCRQCRAGRTSICVQYATVGLHRDGGLAEFVRVPAHIAFRADARGLRDDVAALAQPMAIAVHALRRGAPLAGEEVLVIGAGGIGAFLTFALARAGARVTVADVRAERLSIAERLGAHATVRAGEAAAVRDELSAVGVVPSLTFEVSGTQAGLDTAVAATDPGGRIVTVGIAKHALTYDARRVTTKELVLIGTNALIGKDDVPEAARLLSLDQAAWEAIAPAAIPLERLVEAGLVPLAEGRSPSIKLLVDPWTASTRPTRMS
jgi:(R,R)-butanediol dehydrogenase/meso-butanediol dehydrogenase/diacetyl reductase